MLREGHANPTIRSNRLYLGKAAMVFLIGTVRQARHPRRLASRVGKDLDATPSRTVIKKDVAAVDTKMSIAGCRPRLPAIRQSI